jgi:hypothetical protein
MLIDSINEILSGKVSNLYLISDTLKPKDGVANIILNSSFNNVLANEEL